MLRPIPNLRPSFVWWVNGLAGAVRRRPLRRRLAGGAGRGVRRDHRPRPPRRGARPARRLPASLITGTHPEYCSRAMLDALERVRWRDGGRLMYLGGNGFYWVTSIDPERPHLAEVRRGINGTRAWSSRPGELRHQTTGEQGGLWRYRGRDPNRAGRRRLRVPVRHAPIAHRATGAPPPSHDPEHAWIFDGVEAETDRRARPLPRRRGRLRDRPARPGASGRRPRRSSLATSAGLHPPAYLLVVEDLEVTIPDVTGPTTDRVRADLTYLPLPERRRGVRRRDHARGAAACRPTATTTTSRASPANVLRRFLD